MRPRGIGGVAGHVRRDGQPKVTYATKNEAERARPGQLAYQCALCGRWHMSNYPKKGGKQ